MQLEREYYSALVCMLVFATVLVLGLYSQLNQVEKTINMETISERFFTVNASRILVQLEGVTNRVEIEQALASDKELSQFVTVENNSGVVLVYNPCRNEWGIPAHQILKCKHQRVESNDVVEAIKQAVKVDKLMFGKQLVVNVYSNRPPKDGFEKLWHKLGIPQDLVLWNWRKLYRSELEENKRDLERQPRELAKHLIDSHNGRICDYFAGDCLEHTILVTQWAAEAHQSNQITILPQKSIDQLEALIGLWLGFNIRSAVADRKDVWYRLQMLILLRVYRKELEHIHYIIDNQHEFLVSDETTALLEQWAYNCLSINSGLLGGEHSWAWLARSKQTRVLTDSRTAPANLFPQDYRIGVYLSILVIVIYPTANILKSILKFA